MRSLSNDWGRLAQENDNSAKGTDTISFIHKNQVLSDIKVVYTLFVYDYRLLKEELYKTRITAGGDRLGYNNNTGSPVANLLETKILLNSTISDTRKGVRFILADIKDYFLTTLMKKPE